ncbi:hypothetical protein BJX99DRAFT_258915 [Aspergillus californicus]
MPDPSSVLQLVFNHVVLPPNLPGQSDGTRTDEVNEALVARMLRALSTLMSTAEHDLTLLLNVLKKAVRMCQLVNQQGFVNKSVLLRGWRDLDTDDASIVFVGQQNACILIQKPAADNTLVSFEAFQTSPEAGPALAAKGALQWDFPGVAVVLPASRFETADFQENLASFLEQASLELVDEFAPRAQKAGVEVIETRDTTNPAIITQFLMTLLESCGERLSVPRLRKRVRDDVCWDNAELPWRRSPFWLALRVCIQRLFLRLGASMGRVLYKTLMCALMAQLLDDSPGNLAPECCYMLKAKLCRRLAKLEVEKEHLSARNFTKPLPVLARVETQCRRSILSSSRLLHGEWSSFKKQAQRRIPILPSFAREEDLRFTLPNSAPYIQQILYPCSTHHTRTVDGEPWLPELADIATSEYKAMVSRYSSLTETESAILSETSNDSETIGCCVARCIRLAHRIDVYLKAAGESYQQDPEHLSLSILCALLLWVELDKSAVKAYPLLKEFHPVFEPQLFDVLLLSRFSHMERLQELQIYLHSRCAQALKSGLTIFSDPMPGCFADRYFEADGANELKALQKRIETDSLRCRDAKEAERLKVHAKMERLMQDKAKVSCTGRVQADGTHDIKGCRYCYLVRCRRRLKIYVHEDFLPPDEMIPQKRAIVFELNMPRAFAAYRNATWEILMAFAKVEPTAAGPPQVLLADYEQLQPYHQRKDSHSFTLASHTKSFLGTHYKYTKLLVAPKNVLLPSGLKFAYYDSMREFWVESLSQLFTLAHHFAIHLSPSNPRSGLYESLGFAADAPGPSSYEIVASVPQCPAGVSTQEFTACQSLVGGWARRWLCTLIELGSSNLNLSLRSTTSLLRRSALQVGPGCKDDVLRVVHVIFRDPQFCLRLAEQIEYHVETIAQNWRENNYMESLLCLTARLCALACPQATSRARRLLLRIRRVTMSWVRQLRSEMRTAEAVETADQAARSCFLSSLLCRQTFTPEACSIAELDDEDFQAFVEATLAMQEALVVGTSRFTIETRNLLVRDIKMLAELRQELRELTLRYTHYVGTAINAAWPTGGNERRYTEWTFMPQPHSWWLHAVVPETEHTHSEKIHYHLLEGHLLVDGKIVGKLPAEIRDSELLNELFGNQRLVAFPSNLSGMTYALANEKEGHHVHLGYRQDKLVVRALKLNRLLELVPRQVFGSGLGSDLPSQWVDGCVHWLDLQSKVLEVRPHPRIWRDSSWTLDFTTRRARRRQVSLVNPHSKLFQVVAQIFLHFEEPHMLMALQASDKSLSVELRRMDLTFHVNRKGFLQCRQLFAEIDPDQDPGTVYGLQSMLVLRNVFDRSQRSIITTLGNVSYQHHGMHVLVHFANTGSYARYSIDDVLGRLVSPPEPRLLYHKAQIHALTSCFIPDRLTGRTGTEEALSCLQSGAYRPWDRPSAGARDILLQISGLTPRRVYYPKGRRIQQSVFWDPALTISIQHDGYRPLVRSLLSKFERLSLFHLDVIVTSEPVHDTASELEERSLWRRCLLERSGVLDALLVRPQDVAYVAQDRWSSSKRTTNVREIATVLQCRPSKLHTTRNLAGILQSWPVVGGYDGSISVSLDECLNGELGPEWGGLIRLCLGCRQDNSAKALFQLGLRAFAKGARMTVLMAILAFALFDDLQRLVYPSHPSFVDFQVGEEPSADTILSQTLPFCKPYRASRRGKVQLSEGEHLSRCSDECHAFADHILRQWPCSTPTIDDFRFLYLDIDTALGPISSEWLRMYTNLQLSNQLKHIQAVLDQRSAPANGLVIEPPSADSQTWTDRIIHDYSVPAIRELLVKCGSRVGANYDVKMIDQWMEGKIVPHTASLEEEMSTQPEIAELEHIISQLTSSDCVVESKYGQDLAESIAALKNVQGKANAALKVHELDFVQEVQWFNQEIKKARMTVDHHFDHITEALSRGEARYPWLKAGNLWPVLTPITILEQLRTASICAFGPGMKDMLLNYGVEITKLQQLIRMKEALGKRDSEKLCQEYINRGQRTWDPSRYPDWLLLEIDSNMKIRPGQVTVAEEMIAPRSGCNSVLQMNMGQGKTSMVIPMVACILADGEMLTRVIVPRPLLSQTAGILQTRLGGLLGKELTYVPFSRRTPTLPAHVQTYRELHEDILHGAGILLEIPENILAFRLGGVQRLSDSRMAEAINMVEFQRWKNRSCRDILDECDVALAVKTQLVYPGGSRLALDGHPQRWEVIMTVLDLVARELPNLAKDFPNSLDVVERESGGFPFAYFLRGDVEQALMWKLVNTICDGRTGLLPPRSYTHDVRKVLQTMIFSKAVDASAIDTCARLFSGQPKVQKSLYLLRGLFTHGILLLTLKKRWNVQYGIHPDRDPIAVPFHAKGVPSDQAEWGHPDVSILFTCLAFYHQGLNKRQFRQCLQAVLSSDDPGLEYERWTRASAPLPDPVHHWNIINLDDNEQIDNLWRHLYRITTVINYYLRTFVFPVHAQQFRVKLQASGWDVPLSATTSISSKPGGVFRGPGLTTGFSGTNDNRRLLPLTVQQRDLSELLHTNAQVLTYILQARNRRFINAVDKTGRRVSEIGFLRLLKANRIRVLIDSGAFVLEMDNQTLVRAWLQEDEEAEGAVYFGADNKPWVQYPSGKTIPLLATPFADNMDNCLVYLDEVHTRGTDLKLPTGARGAVTLGMNQTKDHTVQAAMRLRQLGTTQSITFIAPSEVYQSVQDICRRSHQKNLDSSDVISWLLHQTCATNKQLHSLYFWQGTDFCYRTQAAANFDGLLTNISHRQACLKYLQQPEQQTLEELYGPPVQTDGGSATTPDESKVVLSGRLREFMEILEQEYHSQISEEYATPSALEEVEQQRELLVESQEEREMQRPSSAQALTFPGLHRLVQEFVKTGFLGGGGICPNASIILTSTRLWKKQPMRSCSMMAHLFLSPEFARTVQLDMDHDSTNFLRPINWIILSSVADVALIIIPEEAELVIPIIRELVDSPTRLLLYAAPFTKRMLQFNRLDFYSLPRLPVGWSPPRWLPFEVGILAGRLYFDFAEYEGLLHRIYAGAGIACQDTSHSSETPAVFGFLQEWLNLRRPGQDISHTPMGYICQGLKLRDDHPFFSVATGALKAANVSGDFPRSSYPMDEDERSDGSNEDNRFVDDAWNEPGEGLP